MNKSTTLKKALFDHSNDYGFDPMAVISTYTVKKYPTLSVIIPYYNTGPNIKLVLHHLYNSIKEVLKTESSWKYEVIVIDDGSVKRKAKNYIDASKYQNLKILTNEHNLGRSRTRNRGLKEAKHKLCVFMDSDILIDSQLLINHLKIHKYSNEINKKNSITVTFFRFTDLDDPITKDKNIYPSRIMINDWRFYCLYQKTWIGCDDDKKFIGQEIRIIQDTVYFRKWKGMYKAWALSNMVLGGFFIVDRSSAIKVGGFNEIFKSYGFTETSLATKLIAIEGNYVIPILIGGGVHLEDPKTNIVQAEKDKIFKQKHDFYFNTYLNMTLGKSVKGGL